MCLYHYFKFIIIIVGDGVSAAVVIVADEAVVADEGVIVDEKVVDGEVDVTMVLTVAHGGIIVA